MARDARTLTHTHTHTHTQNENTEQEVNELEAQRKAFTKRLPKIKAESKAIRNQQARNKLLSSTTKDQAEQSVSSPSPPSSSSTEQSHDQRRQQQLLELKRQGGITSAHGAEEKEEEGGVELALEDLPYRFLDEDEEPEEGINIYDVEANIAAAREARAAEAAGGVPPSQPQRQFHPDVAQQSRAAAAAASASTTGMQYDVVIPQVTAKTAAPSLGHRHRNDEQPPSRLEVEETAPAERDEIPPTPRAPPPQRQWQQRQPAAAASAGEGTGMVGSNTGGVASSGGGTRGSGGDARRRERVPATAMATDWKTPSSDGTSPTVTVLAGGARGDEFADDSVMERMAMEAEELTEQMDESDAFDGDGMMGW